MVAALAEQRQPRDLGPKRTARTLPGFGVARGGFPKYGRKGSCSRATGAVGADECNGVWVESGDRVRALLGDVAVSLGGKDAASRDRGCGGPFAASAVRFGAAPMQQRAGVLLPG